MDDLRLLDGFWARQYAYRSGPQYLRGVLTLTNELKVNAQTNIQTDILSHLINRYVPQCEIATHHLPESGRHDGRVIQLEGNGPGNVQRRRQLPQNHVPQNLGAVVVVLVGILHERETVHVADERFAVRSGGEML